MLLTYTTTKKLQQKNTTNTDPNPTTDPTTKSLTLKRSKSESYWVSYINTVVYVIYMLLVHNGVYITVCVKWSSNFRTLIYKYEFEFDFEAFAVWFVAADSGVDVTSGAVNIIVR